MKKHLMILAGCALFFGAAPQAWSAEKGLYASGNIGFGMASDADLTFSTLPGVTMEVEYDTGLALGAALGHDYGNMRAEIEIGYQKNDFDKAKVPRGSFALTGDATALSLMLNGYYDFENTSPFTPYITVKIWGPIKHTPPFLPPTLSEVLEKDRRCCYKMAQVAAWAASGQWPNFFSAWIQRGAFLSTTIDS